MSLKRGQEHNKKPYVLLSSPVSCAETMRKSRPSEKVHSEVSSSESVVVRALPITREKTRYVKASKPVRVCGPVRRQNAEGGQSPNGKNQEVSSSEPGPSGYSTRGPRARQSVAPFRWTPPAKKTGTRPGTLQPEVSSTAEVSTSSVDSRSNKTAPRLSNIEGQVVGQFRWNMVAGGLRESSRQPISPRPEVSSTKPSAMVQRSPETADVPPEETVSRPSNADGSSGGTMPPSKITTEIRSMPKLFDVSANEGSSKAVQGLSARKTPFSGPAATCDTSESISLTNVRPQIINIPEVSSTEQDPPIKVESPPTVFSMPGSRPSHPPCVASVNPIPWNMMGCGLQTFPSAVGEVHTEPNCMLPGPPATSAIPFIAIHTGAISTCNPSGGLTPWNAIPSAPAAAAEEAAAASLNQRALAAADVTRELPASGLINPWRIISEHEASVLEENQTPMDQGQLVASDVPREMAFAGPNNAFTPAAGPNPMNRIEGCPPFVHYPDSVYSAEQAPAEMVQGPAVTGAVAFPGPNSAFSPWSVMTGGHQRIIAHRLHEEGPVNNFQAQNTTSEASGNVVVNRSDLTTFDVSQMTPIVWEWFIPPGQQRTPIVMILRRERLGPHAMSILCPLCNERVVTTTVHRLENYSWALDGISNGVEVLGWQFHVFCDTDHYCPNCRRYIGTYRYKDEMQRLQQRQIAE